MVSAAHRLSHAVAGQITGWLSRIDHQRRLGTDDRGLALLIAYHEYMWELLDAIVTTGAARPPAEIRGRMVLVVR